MPTISAHLDCCQRFLQDANPIGTDGLFWSRAELLSYFEDGYRHMIAETLPTRRFTVLDVPPRFPWAISHPWQMEFIGDSPAFIWAFQGQGGWAASHQWMLEQLEGIAPQASDEVAVTQPWLRTYANPTHQHYQFAVPRDTQRVVKIWHNHRLLIPINTRSLDDTFTTWMSIDGLPITWQLGIGPNRTFEVYQIQTAYVANYRHKDAVTNDGNPRFGTARRFSGDRTYDWTSASDDTVPYGIVRSISSPDRQYYPRTLEPQGTFLGRATWLGSSVSSLLVLEAHIPDEITLRESDEAVLLPPQMAKYLRYYTLFRAFNRQGEGYDGLMALFFEQRFQGGIRFLRRLHQLTRKDRRAVRSPVQPRKRRPPRVRLPSNYPAVIRQ